MTGRSLFVGALSAMMGAALLVGCNPPKDQNVTKPADPFATDVAAQVEKPQPKVGATDAADTVREQNGMLFGKLYFPTGDPGTSSLMLEKMLPKEVQANKPFNYEVKVTNITKTKLTAVAISDTIPGTFKIKDSTEGTPDGQPQTKWFDVGTLNPGESQIFKFEGTATQSGSLGMCMSAKYDTALCMVTNVVSPALKLTATGPKEIMKCETLPFKVTIANSGSGQAKNVKVESVLPDGLTTLDGKAAVAFDVATLGAGESKDFAFTAKASKTGNYPIKVTAKADEGLVAEAAALSAAVKEPILAITKTGPEKSFIGQPIPYEIAVTNKGDAVAKNVSVMDSVPKGVTIKSISNDGRADANGRVRWALGEIKPNETVKRVIVVTCEEAGELRTAATVTGDCVEGPVPAMAQTSLTGVPGIAMEVIDNPGAIPVGGQTVYLIEITNQGTAAGTNIKLVCSLEDQMQLLSATGDTKETVDGKTITFAPIGSLAPKAKATFKVTVKAAKAGDVRFKASITSDQLSRPVEETEATNFFGQ